MIIIFDLDHTLLNAEKIKLALSRILKMSRKDFSSSYHKLFGQKSDLYNPFIHLDLLIQTGKVDARCANSYKQRIRELLARLDSFLVPGVENLLKELKSNGHFLILISHGNVVWQNRKIKNLKIKKYFRKIIVTNENKADSFKFLKNKKEEILIVNDNARENEEILKFLPKAQAVLIKGIHSNNIKHSYKQYSFRQAAKMLINKY